MSYQVFAYNDEDVDNTPRTGPLPFSQADLKIDPSSNSSLLILRLEQDGAGDRAVLEGSFSYNSLKTTGLDVTVLQATSLTYYTNGVITQRELFAPAQDPMRLVFGTNKERDEFFVGDDVFVGSTTFALDDLVMGHSGNDRFTGYGSGQYGDYFDGEAGTDVAFLWGNSAEYKIETSSFYNLRNPYGSNVFGFKVDDKVENRDGTDRYVNVEQLNFADATVDLSTFAKTAQLTKAEVTKLAELYIASFNRAPDALGLNYWGSRFAEGMSLDAIAKSFFVQPETVAAYPSSQATSTFVTTVYNNVLSRGPDKAGLDYWVNQIDDGAFTKDVFLLAIINGAKAETGSAVDRQTLANKASVGLDYAFSEGLSNISWSKDVMAGVTSALSSVDTAKAKSDAYGLAAATGPLSELTIKMVGVWDGIN